MENLRETYNKRVHIWDSVQPEKTWGFEELKKFVALVQEGRVLDLGCAAGAQSRYLIDAGLKVVGIDFSENMIEAAKKRVPEAKFFVMDILNLDLPPQFFDGIYARASLLHLPKSDIRKALINLHNILKKEGIIYIALREGEGEKNIPDKDRGNRFFSFYKRNEIEKVILKAKFEIIEMTHEKHNEDLWIQMLASKA